MDEPLVVEQIQPLDSIKLMEINTMTEYCAINRDDVARESSLERNALANAAQAERLSLENLNKIDSDTQNVDETVQRFGFANLNATGKEGSEGRGETERFGFQNLGATQRASDLGVTAADAARSASETYGYRGVVATKDAEKDVLESICRSTAGLSAAAREILMGQQGGFKDVLLQAAQNTQQIQMSMCADTKEILLQACNDTASIKTQSANEFKDVLLQAASNTGHIREDVAHGVKDIQLQACADTDSIKSKSADQFKDLLLQNAAIAQAGAVDAAKNAAAVALQNTLNAKDAEITATINAKDSALAAAINYEKLFGQADRNTAAIQAAIAECCCEQKELVIERTGHTDALIRALDEGRVKEELRFAREELTALRLRASLTPPPVAAVAL
jgi:hypothetical protein